jgi:hypothetical protein
MKPEKGSSERATTPTYAISISVEPDDLELSEELLRMDAEERRRLEREVARLMTEQIEASLFSAFAAPAPAAVRFPYQRDEQPFVFYRIKS